MIIVLDTNIVICSRKRLLRGAEFETLSQIVHAEEAVLTVPRVVVQEAVRRYREDLQSELAAIASKIAKANLLLPEPIAPPDVDVGVRTSTYEEELLGRIAEIGGSITEYGDLTVETLVDRDLARRRPFKGSSKKPTTGFRDALIWETILQRIAERDHTTVFVSKNKHDFGSADDELHPHLAEDLRTARLPSDSVVLCESMQALSENHLKPRLERVGTPGYGVPEERYTQYFTRHNEDFIEEFDRHLKEMADKVSDRFEGASDPRVSALFDLINFEWVAAFRFDDSSILLTGTGEAEATISFFRQRDLDTDNSDYGSAWNDRTSWTEKSVTLAFDTEVVYNPDWDEFVSTPITYVSIV